MRVLNRFFIQEPRTRKSLRKGKNFSALPKITNFVSGWTATSRALETNLREGKDTSLMAMLICPAQQFFENYR